ncbi:MAG: hypothetical protein RLZZ23_1507 [Verrucomicrobiota bacterium]|jgi:hypothetical protein
MSKGGRGGAARGHAGKVNSFEAEDSLRVAAPGGGWREYFQVSGLGNREPGTGVRVQVRVRDVPNLNQVLRT